MKSIKYDKGKPEVAHAPTKEIEQIIEVMDFGAAKYDRNNWRGGMEWSRYGSAALRHIFAWLRGEQNDSESGLHHLAHACCCLLFLMWYENNDVGDDDRWKEKRE